MSDRPYMPPSKSTEYETPHDLFDKLWEEFGPFDLDPCGQKEAHYSAHKIVQHGGGCYDGSTDALDGLTQPWYGNVFMNPPYGKQASKWLEKAVTEIAIGTSTKTLAELTPGGWSMRSRRGANRVVALLPARTDVRWWHEYVQGRAYVRFLRGRLRFHGEKGLATFPSCIVVWGATLQAP